ncbi:hypothetical protein AB1L88_26370 [Tautonia sp. JC769]|uniref:hypothetical protein n=1 Tax=Tautonia sp. JC769 TaxID=3232135 RepID=UPI00345844B4
MGRPRASIAGLMVVIAAVAANLALLRSVYERDLGLVFQAGPMGLACQLGLLRLVVGPPGARGFWLGFAGASGLLVAIVAWVVMGGAYRAEIASFWMTVTAAVAPSAVRDEDRFILGSLALLVWTLPQLALATAAGAIAGALGPRFAGGPAAGRRGSS